MADVALGLEQDVDFHLVTIHYLWSSSTDKWFVAQCSLWNTTEQGQSCQCQPSWVQLVTVWALHRDLIFFTTGANNVISSWMLFGKKQLCFSLSWLIFTASPLNLQSLFFILFPGLISLRRKVGIPISIQSR